MNKTTNKVRVTPSLILSLLIVGEKPLYMENTTYRHMVFHMRNRVRKALSAILAGITAVAIVVGIVLMMVHAWDVESRSYYAKNDDNYGHHWHVEGQCTECSR